MVNWGYLYKAQGEMTKALTSFNMGLKGFPEGSPMHTKYKDVIATLSKQTVSTAP
jgi:hypothetical protein